MRIQGTLKIRLFVVVQIGGSMEDAKNKMAGIMKGTNFFRHIALLIAFVFLTTDLTACIQNHKIYEDGYWQYIVIGKNTFFPQNSDDREVAIVGLTESARSRLLSTFRPQLTEWMLRT